MGGINRVATLVTVGLGWSGASLLLGLVVWAMHGHAPIEEFLTAAFGGALITLAGSALLRVPKLSWPHYIRQCLIGIVVGYPVLGLLLSGLAFLRQGFDGEARLIVFLNGTVVPALGIPLLMALGPVEPRAMVRKAFAFDRTKGGWGTKVLLPLTLAAGFWSIGYIRYAQSQPSKKQRAAHAASEDKLRGDLATTAQLASEQAEEFLNRGVGAVGLVPVQRAPSTLYGALSTCLDWHSDAVTCGLIEPSGRYVVVSRTRNTDCGPCAELDCTLLESSPSMTIWETQLPDHSPYRAVQSSRPEWLKPEAAGGYGCEQVSVAARFGDETVVATLSLSKLSKRLNDLAGNLPGSRIHITDGRGFLVASSAGGLTVSTGTVTSICMSIVGCGDGVEDDRVEALRAIEDDQSSFAKREHRYVHRLGVGRKVPVPSITIDPDWFLTVSALGPDM